MLTSPLIESKKLPALPVFHDFPSDSRNPILLATIGVVATLTAGNQLRNRGKSDDDRSMINSSADRDEHTVFSLLDTHSDRKVRSSLLGGGEGSNIDSVIDG